MTKLPEENLDLIKKVLGKSYSEINVKSISVLDDLDSETCDIVLKLSSGITVEARGVGIVDAIFSGLKSYFSGEFRSLSEIELTKFFAKAKSEGTGSEVEVELIIKNSYNKSFVFVDNSNSLITSSTRVSVAVVEYFVNAEKAFFQVFNALNDARDRNREDLVNRFESELSLLVENTSYSDLLKK